MEAIVEVGYKEGVFDATAAGIKKDVLDLGIKGVKHISTHQLYFIKGNLTEKNLRLIAQNILTDPIIQYYRIVPQPLKGPASSGRHFAVEVWFKKGVTDNVGDSVKKAIEDLGLDGVTEVHSGRKVIIEGALKKQHIVNIATRLLANEVVEDYKIYGES